jgi:hypothetical protein
MCLLSSPPTHPGATDPVHPCHLLSHCPFTAAPAPTLFRGSPCLDLHTAPSLRPDAVRGPFPLVLPEQAAPVPAPRSRHLSDLRPIRFSCPRAPLSPRPTREDFLCGATSEVQLCVFVNVGPRGRKRSRRALRTPLNVPRGGHLLFSSVLRSSPPPLPPPSMTTNICPQAKKHSLPLPVLSSFRFATPSLSPTFRPPPHPSLRPYQPLPLFPPLFVVTLHDQLITPPPLAHRHGSPQQETWTEPRHLQSPLIPCTIAAGSQLRIHTHPAGARTFNFLVSKIDGSFEMCGPWKCEGGGQQAVEPSWPLPPFPAPLPSSCARPPRPRGAESSAAHPGAGAAAARARPGLALTPFCTFLSSGAPASPFLPT